MSGRQLFVLWNDAMRARAIEMIRHARPESRVVITGPKRTLDQNSRLWAMLTELSDQIVWHGKKLDPEDWKLVMMAGLKRELRLVPNIDGDGFVNLGTSSSDLSKEEMGDLFIVIEKFGAEHGVKFHGPGDEAE